MSTIECISLTAGITTIIHFATDCFGFCINENNYEITK